MNLKEKLLNIKDYLLSLKKDKNRNYEFDGKFEDHPLGLQDTYRLYYVNYHRINEYDGCIENNVGMIDFPCRPFKLPDGMDREDAFKVLSYLTDFVEKNSDIEPMTLKSVKTLDAVLDLDRFGFEHVEECDEERIANLFTVTGRLLLFEKSKLYKKYFEWYREGVTLDEVTEIYSKCGKEFKDIVWLEDEKENEKLKTYRKIK